MSRESQNYIKTKKKMEALGKFNILLYGYFLRIERVGHLEDKSLQDFEKKKK